MDSPLAELMDEGACYAKLIHALHPDGLRRPRCGRGRHGVHRKYRTLLNLAGVARIDDLVPAAVHGGLDRLRELGLSARTLNAHVKAIKSFSRWLRVNRRAADDSLVGLAKFNEKADRRTISVDELRRVIAAAAAGPHKRMSGPSWALCYRLAATTGLRYAEIRSLTPAAFALDAQPPTVTVKAGYTKNGETATPELVLGLVVAFRPHLATLPQGAPSSPCPKRGPRCSGSTWRPPASPTATRKGWCSTSTRCGASTPRCSIRPGVSPRVVQQMMRHSTLELTGRYTRPRREELGKAEAAQPDLDPERVGPGGGEDPVRRAQPRPIREDFATHLPCAGDARRRPLAVAGGKNETTPRSRGLS